MNCNCGSDQSYEKCCGPFLEGRAYPETAEKLMRSRYTAYARAEIEYLKKTILPEDRKGFDAKATREWAKNSKWKKLEIVDTKDGGPEDRTGMVEFVATYEKDGRGIDHHEVSQFRRGPEGEWLFVDGEAHEHNEGEGHHHHEKIEPVVREAAKVGRNDLCPCGSGKKFKKCCG